MNIPLNMLRAFATVYETGGVRSAARQLNITHSAVSRHLRELEAWIGAPLFIRTAGKRALTFSPEGHALGRTAISCLGELQGAVTSIRENRLSNAVILSTTHSFAARWLLPRLASFEFQHPWVQLSVVADQRVQLPADEGADLSIRMGIRPWPGLECQPLMDDVLYPVMSPAYWDAFKRPAVIADLSRLRLLHDRDPNASWAIWKKQYGPATLDTRTGSRFTSSDLVLCGAEHGLGVALARDRFAHDSIGAGTLLRPIDGAEVHMPQAYWIVRSHSAPNRDAVTLAIDWLIAEANRSDAE